MRRNGEQITAGWRSRCAIWLAWLGLLLALCATTHAGNPLSTNDPLTPGRNGWEVNVSHGIRASSHIFTQDLPRLNINYGSLENNQWKISIPGIIADPEDGAAHGGLGDIQLGYKYRFLGVDEKGLMASVYPQLLVPTGDKDLFLGGGRYELDMPLQLAHRFFDDKLLTYAEVGYNHVFDDPKNDSWHYGLAGELTVTENLVVLGEVGGFAFPRGADPDDTFFNVGFQYRFHKNVALQTAFGRSFHDRSHGTPDLLTYVGLHITWGGNNSEESSDPRELALRTPSRFSKRGLARLFL